jgi:hypothetical protein
MFHDGQKWLTDKPKIQRLLLFNFQRYNHLDDGYGEVHTKYSETMNTKQCLEKELMQLQNAFDEERSARALGSDHIVELESEF